MMNGQDTSTKYGELFEPGVADDPHPTYERLLTECPVARATVLGSTRWLVARYDDVLFALRRPDLFSSVGTISLGEQPLVPEEVDPPRHTAYRRLLNPRFVPREIEQLEPDVRRMVVELIDGFAGRGSCDFHEELATPLPSGIFLAFMGLPVEDLPMFLRWRDDTIRPDVEPGDVQATQAIREATARAMNEYFRSAIAAQRQRPDDSLLSRLVHADIGGDELTETELLGMCHLLLLGGLDTVTATLDCMVAYLAAHPEDRRRLVTDPSCIPGAVEELLRFSTPVMGVPRAVTADVVLGGITLRAGDVVTLLLGAANDDCRAFADREVDFERRPNRHLAFGASHHFCLGAHLARLELRVALEELHRRIPNYRIADGAVIRYSPRIRQAQSLPLVFDPS